MGRGGGAALRRGLVAELRRAGALADDRVAAALEAVPRERFVPEAVSGLGLAAVYRNEVIVTKRDRRGMALSSSSQPSIVAAMLDRLDVRPGHRVLEVGAGTGWNAALLTALAGPHGSVTSVDVDPEVAARAAGALAGGPWAVDVVTGDGRQGWPSGAPYDRIVVTASGGDVHRAWFDQLVPGGLLELPLRLTAWGGQAVVTLRREADGFRSVAVVDGGFMPLRGPDGFVVARPQASVAADEWVGEARRLVSVTGDAIGRLPTTQRRRLLALALGAGRRRPLGVRARRRDLDLFVGLAAPRDGLVRRLDGRSAGVGVVSARPLGLAVLGAGRTVSGLTAWGAAAAEDRLAGLVDRWRETGRPALEDLVVSVRYGARPRAWRTDERGDAVLGFDWRR